MSTTIAPAARSGRPRSPAKGLSGLDVKLPDDKSVNNTRGDHSQPRRATLHLPFPAPTASSPLATAPTSSLPLKAHIPRHLLLRRRSSFPPADAPHSMASTPDSLAPEANLLDLLAAHTQQQRAATALIAGGMPSETEALWSGKAARDRRLSEPSGRREGTSLRLPSPGKIAQYGSDLAWKTILGSVVDVDGVGSLQVSRVLQEIWARGGGDTVTAQSLWPAIIVSLSLPVADHDVGAPVASPAPHAASALQTLYTLTLRHWEPAIFSGLLATFGQPGLPIPEIARSAEAAPPVDAFGITTPVRGLDLSQWMNLTPGADWSIFGGTGLTPRRGSLAPTLGPSGLSFELGDFPREKDIESNLTTTARGDEDRARGLGELLAQMEEGREAEELLSHFAAEDSKGKKAEATFLPTPETDNDTPLELTRDGSEEIRKGSMTLTPPESNEPTPPASSRQSTLSLAYTTQATTPASTSSSGRPASNYHSRPHPTALTMPDSTFIPPPPMCMFFSPGFHDLQNGKVGIWKGDLHVQGRGGGKFSVLIVGEAATGHVWQSQSWPSTITYPAEPQPNQSCTATMMPVAHLAREGFTPAAMGMVLCNDANINAFVEMVQGFHAEGVAFHLSTPGKLPIIFLPAKFSSEDPLQRLGIAFMSKPGIPLPPAPTKGPVRLAAGEADEMTQRKKRRRQSAPTQSLPSIPAPSKTSGGAGSRRRQSTAIHTRSGGTRLDRSVIEEEDQG